MQYFFISKVVKFRLSDSLEKDFKQGESLLQERSNEKLKEELIIFFGGIFYPAIRN
jgi:hypothetical protein